MARRDSAPADDRSTDPLARSVDLRSALDAALAVQPVDLTALRRGVAAYVCRERDAGVSAMYAISQLRRIIEDARLTPHEQGEVARHVVVWCVEAYFNRPGTAVGGGDS